MSDDRKHGIVCMWTGIAGAILILGGLAMGLAYLLGLALEGIWSAIADLNGILQGLLALIWWPIALVLGIGLGLISCGLAVVVALCALVCVAGILWLFFAGLARAVSSNSGERNEGGVRLAYFHWTGGWLDGWRAVGSGDGPLTGFWTWLGELGEKGEKSPAEREAEMVRLGERSMIPMYFAVRAPIVALLWGPRVAVAMLLRLWIRWWIRLRSKVRECRECHGWTRNPSWRCPGCGRIHVGLEPSAKFGVFAWKCECGTLLPTRAALDPGGLEAVCPECGGGGDPVEAGRADVAFLGGKGAGKTALAAEMVSVLSGASGGWRVETPAGADGRMTALAAVSESGPRRHLRLYDNDGRAFLDPVEFVRQRYWGHIGAVVFAVDLTDPGVAERVWESWRRVMDREHPGRVRRMSCAVVLTGTGVPGVAAVTGLAPGAGDRQCRAFLERAGAGNLLNGLDGQFRRVRVFAAGAGAEEERTGLWNWTLEQAFGAGGMR